MYTLTLFILLDKGYKQMKAKLGMRKVRPWKWMSFTNPGRRDGLVLHHWRRAADEGKEYPFGRFNKKIELPTFTDNEYNAHLQAEGWTRQETDHLLDLCYRFDLRFTVVHDRWDRESFKKKRSIEDLKERYYGICEKLDVLHVDPGKISKPFVYDADHERRRKEQLNKLYNRTPEQVEEEEMLKTELRKIEARKKEREKKAQDLQKLINQADVVGVKSPAGGQKATKRKSAANAHQGRTPTSKDIGAAIEAAGIKFPDISKTIGVSLRSQRCKLPTNVGQKRTKAIEQMLHEVHIEPQPMPTDEICTQFNDLRSDMVLLYELKNAFSSCEMELQSLKAQYEAVCPGKSLEIPDKLKPHPVGLMPKGERPKNISDVIDVVGNGATPPMRKRKAALEQSNVLKKIKNKNY